MRSKISLKTLRARACNRIVLSNLNDTVRMGGLIKLTLASSEKIYLIALKESFSPQMKKKNNNRRKMLRQTQREVL